MHASWIRALLISAVSNVVPELLACFAVVPIRAIHHPALGTVPQKHQQSLLFLQSLPCLAVCGLVHSNCSSMIDEMWHCRQSR